MPGPNSGKTGRVVIGKPRRRGVQMKEQEQKEAVDRYVQRSKKGPSSHVKTKNDKIRRQLARAENEA